MEISIREWEKKDLPKIQEFWLDYCRHAARSDMQLKPDFEAAMSEWLMGRFRQTSTIGLVAESDGSLAGFLIGRIDDWESVPPVIESRRIGIIDAVYVKGEPTNDDPECFWRADVDAAAERLAAILREENADVFTCYDSNGVYGHPDHVQVHRVGEWKAQSGHSRFEQWGMIYNRCEKSSGINI